MHIPSFSGIMIPSCFRCHYCFVDYSRFRMAGILECGSPAGLFPKLPWFLDLPRPLFMMNSRSDLKRKVVQRCFWGEGYWRASQWLLAPKPLTIGPNLSDLTVSLYPSLSWCSEPPVFRFPFYALQLPKLSFHQRVAITFNINMKEVEKSYKMERGDKTMEFTWWSILRESRKLI